ncbi:MAG: calcium/sodium antiporter [Eubacterium sp.]|nr:calcium/sodium antiporter [Eubacterium sp.]
MEYLLLIAGFALLIKGADFFVDGASSIARALKVPSIVIGLTLVSLGTSAPEAAVSITAGIAGNSDISLGNVIGSNIFNLLPVIGCAALFQAIPTQKDIQKRDLPVNVLSTLLLFAMMLDGKIGRLEGIILLAGIIIYMVVLVMNSLKNRTEESSEKTYSVIISLVLVAVGLTAVILGGQLVVNNATIIARHFGMSDTLVALTIVAIGTSLPELVTSVMAARKGDSGIALGNAIGSCIFNILFIIGISSALAPITVDMHLVTDIILLIIVNILIYIFCRTDDKISRLEGGALLAVYVAYTVYIILR